MGRPTGFLEHRRELPMARPALERIHDWREQHGHADDQLLGEQAARCMGCGTPFCHTGTLIAGVASGCPVNNLIPDWNDLVAREQWREASARLAETNNFPEITGRVCPAPCEGSCVLGIDDAAVTIKRIEQEIADRAWSNGWVTPEPPNERSGRRVAVVGSGPAGLACADMLNRSGHTVTVFERADRIGGLLMYGIPNMKLDKSVVDRRVGLLRAEGVSFRTGVAVGLDVEGEELRATHDAVVLATGATIARDLDVEGRGLRGVVEAMVFLTAATRGVLAGGGPAAAPAASELCASGKRVVVIGGGDTGTDCVATAIRQGAAAVVQLEILPRPPGTRAAENPWPQWPKVYRLDYGQEEAAALWGDDPRQYLVQTSRFEGNAGHVVAVDVVGIEWRAGQDARFVAVDVPGSERRIPADLVLLALGFSGPERALAEALGCTLTGRGTIAADGQMATSVPGVFAAGDCSRGQSLVVWAIREGRAAARGVDRYLAALA